MSRFALPNYTQTPNYIIDEWMSKLSHAEFKFIMLIVRYTCGYHRRDAKISFGHFEKQCGIDKRTAKRISKKFEDMGWINVIHGDIQTANTYEILLEEECDSKKDEVGASGHQGGGMRPPGVGASDPHNKEKEEIKKKNTEGKAQAPVCHPSDDLLKKKEALEATKLLNDQEIMQLIRFSLEDILKACEHVKTESNVDVPVRWFKACISQKWWQSAKSDKVSKASSFIVALKDAAKKSNIKLSVQEYTNTIHVSNFNGGIEVQKKLLNFNNDCLKIANSIRKKYGITDCFIYNELPGQEKFECL